MNENAFGDSEFRKSKEYSSLREEVEKELIQEDSDFSNSMKFYNLLIQKDFEAITGKPWYDPEIHSSDTLMSDYTTSYDWEKMNSADDIESAAWDVLWFILNEQSESLEYLEQDSLKN